MDVILLLDLVEAIFGHLGFFLPSNAFRSAQACTIDLNIAICCVMWPIALDREGRTGHHTLADIKFESGPVTCKRTL